SEDLVGQIAINCLQPQPFTRGIVNQNGLSLLRSLLSDPITRVSWTEKRSDSQSLIDELPSERMPTMPRREVAGKLADTYFEHCNFFSPIFSSKDEFLNMIEPLYGNASASDQSLVNVRFRALVVFGTSILLLNRVDSSVPASRADSYFTAATQLFSQNPQLICTGDLQHLINLLFIIQYCCFASYITAAWHFIGLATRLAIELNLHKERSAAPLPDPIRINERRWLFWSLYTFERNLCAVIGRPFSIPDEAIETALPMSPLDDPQRALAVHLVKCRLLESEIYTTLNQKGPLNGALLNPNVWREDVQRRLLQWHSAVPPIQQSTHLAPAEIFNGSLYNGLILLYYPSHHFPNPSNDDLGVLAQSATDAIDCYKRSFRAGELRFYWRTVHNLFRSGVAIVYCAQTALIERIPGMNLEEANASINSCSSLLWGMVERYPAGQAYRDIFESLAKSVLSQRRGQANYEDQLVFEPRAEHSSLFTDLAMDLGEAGIPSTALDALSWGFGDPP
ncbi:fungal-specific transcription factor domain-containing protein, partial [Thelonectria olida]